MSTLQIIVKTIATTINLLVGYALAKGTDIKPQVFKTYMVFMLINLMGVWI